MTKILPRLKDIDAENGVEYIEALTNYALNTAEISDTQKFIEILKSELSKSAGEKIMTGAEQLIQKGIQQGIQQGMQQGNLDGKLEGERLVLVKLLKSRFGNISTDYLEKIQRADSETLLDLAEKILEAKSLEEIFKNLH